MKPVDKIKVRRLRAYPKQVHEATRVRRAAQAREMGGIRKFVAVMAVLFPRSP